MVGKTINAELVSSADRAYMKATVFCNVTELRDNLSSILKGREANLGLTRLDYIFAKTAEDVNGSVCNTLFILTVDWFGWICYGNRKLKVISLLMLQQCSFQYILLCQKP